MRSYGQYCPIARASEVLAQRWSVIILRNIIVLGCRTFNEIADCAPGLSRALLSTRLRELDRAGVIEIRRKPDRPGSIYEPTEAGRGLAQVMLALQDWGSKWAELTPEQAHPGVVLWMWATFFLDRERLPRQRILVRFDYPTVVGPGRRNWLLVERGDAEICEKYPGGDEHLIVIINDPVVFARWHLGELRWADALRHGGIALNGPRNLVRAFPTWHREHARGPQPLHSPDPGTNQGAATQGERRLDAQLERKPGLVSKAVAVTSGPSVVNSARHSHSAAQSL